MTVLPCEWCGRDMCDGRVTYDEDTCNYICVDCNEARRAELFGNDDCPVCDLIQVDFVARKRIA